MIITLIMIFRLRTSGSSNPQDVTSKKRIQLDYKIKKLTYDIDTKIT